jgi:hypothetical protein
MARHKNFWTSRIYSRNLRAVAIYCTDDAGVTVPQDLCDTFINELEKIDPLLDVTPAEIDGVLVKMGIA